MLNIGQQAARLAQQPTQERIRALKRIIPCATVKTILKQCRRDRRFCPRLPNWFMVWFVIALGLFCPDSYRQIFRWLQRFRTHLTPAVRPCAKHANGSVCCRCGCWHSRWSNCWPSPPPPMPTTPAGV